jgi:hypothetical protein
MLSRQQPNQHHALMVHKKKSDVFTVPTSVQEWALHDVETSFNYAAAAGSRTHVAKHSHPPLLALCRTPDHSNSSPLRSARSCALARYTLWSAYAVAALSNQQEVMVTRDLNPGAEKIYRVAPSLRHTVQPRLAKWIKLMLSHKAALDTSSLAGRRDASEAQHKQQVMQLPSPQGLYSLPYWK